MRATSYSMLPNNDRHVQVFTGLDGEIYDCNDTFLKVFGHIPENGFDLVSDEETSIAKEKIRWSFKNKRPYSTFRYYKVNGVLLPSFSIIVPCFKKSGTLKHFHIFVTPVKSS